MDKRISPEFSKLIAHVVGKFKPTNEEEASIKKFIRLILVIARKYVRPTVEYEDLISAGTIGLIEAVRNFDPSRSTNFSAYAITRIKGRMYEYCISNLTSVSVPTHVGKTKVYVERMTKMLDQEPFLFNSGVDPCEIIKAWSHPLEENVSPRNREEIRHIKDMVKKIAQNSKTTYEELIILAYKSMVTEIGEDDIYELAACTSGEDIERDVAVREIATKLNDTIGEKKTAILVLHHQDFNNEDIAKVIHKRNLTNRRISRQAVRGLLKAAERKAQKHVKPT